MSLSPQGVMPSPKYLHGRSYCCKTFPVANSTRRMEERPLRPVPSYSSPSQYARPCVNAFVSCGNVLTTSQR